MKTKDMVWIAVIVAIITGGGWWAIKNKNLVSQELCFLASLGNKNLASQELCFLTSLGNKFSPGQAATSLVAPKVAYAQSVPDVPQNLSAAASASTQINLTWSTVSTATSYKVYRGIDIYGTFAPIATSTLTGTSYSDTSVSQEMTYYYKVTAVNGNGESAYSGMAYVTTPVSPVPVPVRSNGQPTGTLSVCTTQTTISLTTDENATCKYSTAANTAYASMANAFSITGVTTHSTAISGLTIGSSYAYYVRCRDAAGNTNTDDYTISFSVAYAYAPASGGGMTNSGTAAPIISAITASVSDTMATINWLTSGVSISWIVYGTTTDYSLEQKTIDYLTFHSIILTDLSKSTTYHYQVKSQDLFGNVCSYADNTFTTSGAPAIPTTPVTPTTPTTPITPTTVTTGALAPASATNKVGYTLMKVAGFNDVWVVQNGLKLPVRSLDVFNSSGYASANVETVSANAFEAVESAALIKTADNPDVYLLENNFRRKLASIEIFNEYKLNWNKISIISQSVMDSFSYAPIYKHGIDLYWRDSNNILHEFPAMAIFTAKGYNTRDLITISDMEFGSFAIGENIAP